MMSSTPQIRGLLIDLDGTVYEGSALVPGVAAAIEWLRDSGMPFLFTTNTSRKSRVDVVSDLTRMGLPVSAEEILTAPVAAAAWLRSRGTGSVQLLVSESTYADFEGIVVTDRDPEVVLVGDLGSGFTFELLNSAFRSLRAGAELIAIHRNRFWLPETGPTLDAGPFVAALEYASGRPATLIGKPAPAFFEMAAGLLDQKVDRLAVIGDDLESDIRGGRDAGLTTIQVRTGKFDESMTRSSPAGRAPHVVVESVARLPELNFDAIRAAD
ncbi:MAG: HAD-IIA family hydrolase [marine benthic group bacterium]|nr:HAD-IIA family hydrolase [Gemmatimonadota bacterium]MCL7977710.1 HAD-IIA family hydrolase [Gemmatimonadota bacterium]